MRNIPRNRSARCLPSTRINCPQTGLTLIELLLAIATIAILSKLLAVGVGNVRKSALQAEAASKMRHIGLAIQYYVNDNDGRFPGPLRGYQKPTRVNNYQLIRYIEAHLSQLTMPDTVLPNPAYLSKGYSQWLKNSPYRTADRISGADIYVMYASHMDDSGNNIRPWGYPGEASRMLQTDFYQQFPPSATRAMWDAQGTNRSPNYNELYKGRNVLFFDWHVENVPAS